MVDDTQIPTVEPGVYYHYKDPLKHYEVIGVGQNTETDEFEVIYKPLYESEVEYWTRSYTMFVGSIEKDGKIIPRFTKVN